MFFEEDDGTNGLRVKVTEVASGMCNLRACRASSGHEPMRMLPFLSLL